MKPFTIHEVAGAEVEEAIKHQEAQSAGLNLEFRQDFESAVAIIHRMARGLSAIDAQRSR